jgi:hypothetical protein
LYCCDVYLSGYKKQIYHDHGGGKVGKSTHTPVHVDGLAKQIWNWTFSANVTATTTELNAGESKSSATRKSAVAAAPLLLIGTFPDWERRTLPRDSIGVSIGAPLVSPRANLPIKRHHRFFAV